MPVVRRKLEIPSTWGQPGQLFIRVLVVRAQRSVLSAGT
jgi:hypothetical protein